MAKCPHCQNDVPLFSLKCNGCGKAIAAETLREDTIRQLGGDGPLSTLRGIPGQSLDGQTLQDGQIDAPLDDKTLREPPGPALIPLERASKTIADQGPARLREADPLIATAPIQAALSVPPQVRPSLLRPGDVVEGYRVEEEVGRGGMGRVYRAIHEITDQEVALKMLLPKLVGDPRLRARFVNEAKVLAQMSHPNLVPLLGYIEARGGVFIVMPFIRGITLERMLARQGRLALGVAESLFVQIADGLSAIHAHGVLHRDLKPGNIIITSDGTVLITDFGIARSLGSKKLTVTGMVVGTAEYLSPEQASGTSRDDLRSDIYSLGVLLYEMVCGQVPFRHSNAAQILLRHVQSPPPPPRTIRPDLPKPLEDVLLKALSKKPEDRFATVEIFLDAAISAFADERPDTLESVDSKAEPPSIADAPTAQTPSSQPKKAQLTGQIILGLLIGAALALGAWFIIERT